MLETKKDNVVKSLIVDIIESEGLEDSVCNILVMTEVKNTIIIRIDIRGDKISKYRMEKLLHSKLQSWIPEFILINAIKFDNDCNQRDDE